MKNKYAPYLLLGAGVLILMAVFVWGKTDESIYLRSARAGGDYLVRQMSEDGSFVYEYDPLSDTETNSYNILRHAGTTYSLLELYETTGEIRYFTAATHALLYLMVSSDPCPTNSEATCVIEANEIKLGGNGLALLAVTKYLDVADASLLGKIGTRFVREDLEEYAEGLARFIVGLQKPSGEFTPHKTDAAGTPDLTFVSEYYPGEAMFALARFSELTRDRRWVEAAHRGAEWIINVRDKNVATNNLPPDHWMLYALNELYADTQNLIYVDHTKRLVDGIVSSQHRDKTGEEADWNGGYYSPPRSTPTATRSEGLGAAYHLFTRAGDPVYAGVAKDAMEKGVEFEMRTQMTQRKAHEFNANGRALGGFHETLDDYTIRIDYVQHNISALLALEKILSNNE